jgi:hypothetical protein
VSLTNHCWCRQHPINPLQAFAICLATLDTKFTDSKLYDSVSKLMAKKLY